MRAYNMLFTAPLDFDERVWDKYFKTFNIVTPGDNTEVWVCNPKQKYTIDGNILEQHPGLLLLATPSTGTNHIDVKECNALGIKVLSLNDNKTALFGIAASAEFTFKLILDALRMPIAHELQGRKVGLVGYGRIGQRLFSYLRPFGATVYVHDPHVYSDMSLAQLFSTCDIIVICCALTEETAGMITPGLVRRMPKGGVFVNTARGEIIDEGGLIEVMDERPDLRVALDVLTGEVTGTANPKPFLDRRAIVTPHIAGETFESRTKAARIIYDLIVKELDCE